MTTLPRALIFGAGVLVGAAVVFFAATVAALSVLLAEDVDSDTDEPIPYVPTWTRYEEYPA